MEDTAYIAMVCVFAAALSLPVICLSVSAAGWLLVGALRAIRRIARG